MVLRKRKKRNEKKKTTKQSNEKRERQASITQKITNDTSRRQVKERKG